MITRRNLATTAMALGLVAGSATELARPALAAQKDIVTISWLPIMQTTPLYVALEQNLFEKAGIEAKAVRFEAPNQIIDSLVANRADCGAPGAAAGIAVLAEQKFPGTFKVFGLQGGSIKLNRLNEALIVANGSPIKSFADLKGKSLGHLPGIQWRTISRFMIRKAGLNPDTDVRLVELAVGLQVQAVVAGTVDATLSLEPVGAVAVAMNVASRALVNPCEATVSDPFYSGVSLLTTQFIKERPGVAKRVVDVLDAATKFAESNFDAVRPMYPKYTPIKDNQVSFLGQPYLRGWADLDATDRKSYQAFVDIFVSEGVMKKPLDIDDLILKSSDLHV